MKNIEKRKSEKTSNLKLMSPGLSIRVEGVRGPFAEGDLTICKNFRKK